MSRFKVYAILFIIFSLSVLFLIPEEVNSVSFIDLNNNGVWDDLDLVISGQGETREQRDALKGLMIMYQERLLAPEIGSKESESESLIPDDFERSLSCMSKTWGGFDKWDADLIEQLVLNTWSRHRAWAKYNANASGGLYSLWNEETHGNPCTFKRSK